jgi:AraC-like DNA-binding protein
LVDARLRDIVDASILADSAGSHIFPPSVRQIEAYMLTHLDEVPSLARLSSLVGLDKYYVAHMFSKHVGLSPLAFHTRARLLQARSLIAQGWSLSDTSAYLTFSDQSHFGRHFKRVYDMTPGEYQRSVVSQ